MWATDSSDWRYRPSSSVAHSSAHSSSSRRGGSAPDPWLDAGYVTEAPSSTAIEAGLYPAIVGSVIIIALVAVLSFVLGVGTSVFLEEYMPGSGILGSLTRLLQVNIANLAAIPSVVYGLLGLGLFANLLGFGLGNRR